MSVSSKLRRCCTIPLNPDHAATEKLLADSPLNTLALRSGFYAENILGNAEAYISTGKLPSLSGQAPLALAARDEMAEAAARLLMTEAVPAGVITLAGARVTKAEVAQALADASGKSIELAEVSREEYVQGLEVAGMPAPVAQVFADVDFVARDGAYDADSADFERILGRAPKTFAQIAGEYFAG